MAKRLREAIPDEDYDLLSFPSLSQERSCSPQPPVNYRCPHVKVHGIVDSFVWHNLSKSWCNILPVSANFNDGEAEPLKINTWRKSHDLQPVKRYMTNAYKERAKAVMNPLSKLKYDVTSQRWCTQTETESSVKDSRYLDAFKYNMANSKGRNFIHTMLTQFYDIEDSTVDVIVENIGGAAKSSDATRFLHFHLSKREPNGRPPSSDSDEELSPEKTPQGSQHAQK